MAKAALAPLTRVEGAPEVFKLRYLVNAHISYMPWLYGASQMFKHFALQLNGPGALMLLLSFT